MNITIKTIPHHKQRYSTVGDWTIDKHDNITIKVSKLDDWRWEMLVAVHELVEVLLCRYNDVRQRDVDRFDMEFEKNRNPGDESEPGDNPRCPYRLEHSVATAVERLLAAELGVWWKEYDDKIQSLP